jgi:Cu-Zn family superoxide dismutase
MRPTIALTALAVAAASLGGCMTEDDGGPAEGMHRHGMHRDHMGGDHMGGGYGGGGHRGGRMRAPDAVAEIADASGAAKGTAEIRATPAGLRVIVHAMNMQPGTYGVHLHAVGKCEGPAFASSGGHWNPTMKQHGMDNPAGAHEGDLPNITIGADGTGMINAVSRGAVLSGASGLLDADGASIMIHAGPDDYRTDPSGNSGARIACGIVHAR